MFLRGDGPAQSERKTPFNSGAYRPKDERSRTGDRDRLPPPANSTILCPIFVLRCLAVVSQLRGDWCKHVLEVKRILLRTFLNQFLFILSRSIS